MYTISSGTKIVLKNCAGVTCLALDLAGQLVVFEEGGMQLVMKGSDNECFLPWKQACRGSSLPSAFKDVRYAVFDDEGDIILGYLLSDDDGYQPGFKICKLPRDGNLLLELHVHEDEGDHVTSLAFDPHTRRVLFTSSKSHAVHAIDSSSHANIVVGSKDEEGSQQGTCPAAEARFSGPRVAVDGDGNCVISDEWADKVYLFRPARGTVSVLAGSGEEGDADGVGEAASFDGPLLPCIDRGGRVSLYSGYPFANSSD